MTKATLEFTLPEEKESFLDAQRGTAYLAALQTFDTQLRCILKHETDKHTEAELAVYAKMRDKLYCICLDRGFDIFE